MSTVVGHNWSDFNSQEKGKIEIKSTHGCKEEVAWVISAIIGENKHKEGSLAKDWKRSSVRSAGRRHIVEGRNTYTHRCVPLPS